jgi:hypothetical protein
LGKNFFIKKNAPTPNAAAPATPPTVPPTIAATCDFFVTFSVIDSVVGGFVVGLVVEADDEVVLGVVPSVVVVGGAF